MYTYSSVHQLVAIVVEHTRRASDAVVRLVVDLVLLVVVFIIVVVIHVVAVVVVVVNC